MKEETNFHNQDRDLQAIDNIDPTVHAPARLMILALLAVVDNADFNFLLNQTGLTRGNLASHLSRLEEAGYVNVEKTFLDRIPHTVYALTGEGLLAIGKYRENMQKVINLLLK